MLQEAETFLNKTKSKSMYELMHLWIYSGQDLQSSKQALANINCLRLRSLRMLAGRTSVKLIKYKSGKDEATYESIGGGGILSKQWRRELESIFELTRIYSIPYLSKPTFWYTTSHADFRRHWR